VRKVGVVGAGTMGAGVAQVFAVAGYPVRLRDIAEAPLGRGMGAIKKKARPSYPSNCAILVKGGRAQTPALAACRT